MVEKKDEKKKEETKQAPKEKEQAKPTGDNDNGDASKEKGDPSMIKEAKDAAAELRKANEEKKALLDREEKLMAEKALGGKGEMSSPEKPKEETPEEYAERVEKGEADPFKEDGITK